MAEGTWTRVECLCGKVAAIPEGGFFPLCASCGRRMVAPGEGRVVYDFAALPHPRFGPDADEEFVGRGRAYSDQQLAEVLAARSWPVESQDWPRVPSPDGGSYTVPPWEKAP